MTKRSMCRSVMGLVVVIGLATVVLSPFLIEADPLHQDLLAALAPPSRAHPLGMDYLGRDVLARIVHGTPWSLGISLLCMALASSVGITLGLIAAYGPRWVDTAIMRLADLMLAFPGLLLALLIAGFYGGGVIPMLIGIKLSLWPQFARMSRATAQGALQEAHVEAAVIAGFSSWFILTRHVLPSVLTQTMPLATLGVGNALLSISALGFLGLGQQPPQPEWGAMISEMLPYLSEAPIQIAAPCLAIFMSVLVLTLAGEAAARRFNHRKAEA